MNKMKIAVIAGGNSSERAVSMRSTQQVFDCLDRQLFDPHIVTITGENWECQGQSVDKNDFSYCGERFDYALIMIHGTPGENGILQGYFELTGIPYSSCNTEVSALTFNKSLCKKIVSDVRGISLARDIIVHRSDMIDPDAIAECLGLPFFAKPNASGSSCGITKVKSRDQIQSAINDAMTEGEAVMLEQFIEGTEVSQGVMIIAGQPYVLPITELVSKNEFFDYQAKYTEGYTREITPARIPNEVAEQLNASTLAVYKVLGCRGVVRVDYIIREGTPYFIEVNTVPGMSAGSIVPQQWQAMGLTMQQAFTMIITNKPL